jgi:hypothetical protein
MVSCRTSEQLCRVGGSQRPDDRTARLIELNGAGSFMDSRHWLENDFVALAVLLAGIGFVELIVLSI